MHENSSVDTLWLLRVPGDGQLCLELKSGFTGDAWEGAEWWDRSDEWNDRLIMAIYNTTVAKLVLRNIKIYRSLDLEPATR